MKIEFFKFIVVGSVNFFFTLALFYLFVTILAINPIFSIAFVSATGLFLTYYLNFTWVFLPGQKVNFRENLVRYMAANGVSIALNMFLLHVLLLNTELDPFWAQFALIPFLIAFNFATAKFWSLRN